MEERGINKEGVFCRFDHINPLYEFLQAYIVSPEAAFDVKHTGDGKFIAPMRFPANFVEYVSDITFVESIAHYAVCICLGSFAERKCALNYGPFCVMSQERITFLKKNYSTRLQRQFLSNYDDRKFIVGERFI